MKGNRLYKRFTIDVMNIKGRLTVSSQVDVLDINSNGVKLKADLRLDISKEYILHIQDEEKSIKLKGVVEWSSLSEPVEGPDGEIVPRYSASLQFQNASADVMSDLNYFIEALNSAEEERFSKVSLIINGLNNAIYEQPQDFKVKKISLGGMLIGSGRAFEIDSRYPMEITFPGNRGIQFTGKITSCFSEKEAAKLRYDIGVAFFEMPEQDKETLSAFITKLDEEDTEEIDIWFRHKDI